ncbi:MAG: amidohydrolase family protein, partial [Pseudomonadales bacterium]
MTKIIDLHAHVVLEAGFGQAGHFGPELAKDADGVPFFRIGQYQMKPMEYRGTVFMEIDQRLERMAKMGIDQQLLSPNPLTMFHHIPAEVANRFCQIHNDAMAEIVSAHPNTFFGAACLPMQAPDLAIKELERATQELGLIAAYTGTDFPVTLDDRSLDEFYSALTSLDVPLFMHPASSGGDAGPLDARLNRFNLSILLG